MKNITRIYVNEVEDKLKALSNNIASDKSEKLKKYLGTNLSVYGLNTKTQVEVYKNSYSFFNNNPEEIFEVFDIIFNASTNFETKNQAYIFLDKNYKFIPKKQLLKILPHWVNKIDNWAHSDNLSKFLTRLLEDNETQEDFLKIIHNWNLSSNPWQRRQSLVSLYYYARTKNKNIAYTLSQKLIFNLIHDNDYYVQKAVGWTLRESYNVYPEKTHEFIAKHIKSISSTAFTTSIEKMRLEEKQFLKLKRK